ncbi:MAG: hypothetical protein V1848_01435 [Candidatus Magasanikbacteria bacterium]
MRTFMFLVLSILVLVTNTVSAREFNLPFAKNSVAKRLFPIPVVRTTVVWDTAEELRCVKDYVAGGPDEHMLCEPVPWNRVSHPPEFGEYWLSIQCFPEVRGLSGRYFLGHSWDEASTPLRINLPRQIPDLCTFNVQVENNAGQVIWSSYRTTRDDEDRPVLYSYGSFVIGEWESEILFRYRWRCDFTDAGYISDPDDLRLPGEVMLFGHDPPPYHEEDPDAPANCGG